MVVYKNNKFACLSCIRGHRSSTCEHTDRVLLQVRKPGRKSSTESKNRIAIVKKDSTPPELNFPKTPKFVQGEQFLTLNIGDVKDMKIDRQLTSNNLIDPSYVDEEIVYTDKYVFTHVGDNLFKREVRIGNLENETEDICLASLPKLKHPPIADNITSTLEPHITSGLPIDETPSPVVIAPMHYQTSEGTSILSRIGVSTEEAHQLWPGYVNEMDMLYVPDCAIPGKCKCGDGCKCTDCYEHNPMNQRHDQ